MSSGIRVKVTHSQTENTGWSKDRQVHQVQMDMLHKCSEVAGSWPSEVSEMEDIPNIHWAVAFTHTQWCIGL